MSFPPSPSSATAVANRLHRAFSTGTAFPSLRVGLGAVQLLREGVYFL